MIPIYSLTSFISLFLNEGGSLWVHSIRDCYEAWVIYCFLQLCIEYMGGPALAVSKLEGQSVPPSLSTCTCCLPTLFVNAAYLRRVKQGVLQFVILKPLMAAITIIVFETGHYHEASWSPSQAYFWITLIYNLSYSVALYALALFYFGAHDALRPFKPLLKFVMIKLVIFLSFWQAVLFSILVRINRIRAPRPPHPDPSPSPRIPDPVSLTPYP